MARPPRAHRGPALVGLSAALGLPTLFFLAALPDTVGLDGSGPRLVQALRLQPGTGHGTVSALLGHAACQIPLGPLSLRVATVQALAVALALCGVLALSLRFARQLQVREGIAVPLALGLSWFAAGTPDLWRAATGGGRAGVGLALLCWSLERLVASLPVAGGPPASARRRAAYLGALGAGLCLSESPLLGLPLAVATLPFAATLFPKTQRTRLWAAFWLGACAYLCEPLRALATGVTPAWPLQGIAARSAAGPMRATLDVFFIWALALVGALLCLRTGLRDRVLPVVGLAAASGALLLGLGRDSAFGQQVAPLLLTTCVVLGALAPLCLRAAGGERPGQARLIALVALTAVALGFVKLQTVSTRHAGARVGLGDRLSEQGLRNVPARAIVLTQSRAVYGPLSAIQLEEGARPDVTFIDTRRLLDAGFVAQLVADERALSPLLRGYLLSGALTTPELQTVAARRPVLVELTRADAADLSDTVRPAGLFYEVLPDGVTTADERGGAEQQAARYETLVGDVDVERLTQPERALLLAHFRTDAVYYDAFGDQESAAAADTRADALRSAVAPE